MRKETKEKAVRVSKEILTYLFLSGAIFIAASSPYFVLGLIKNISKLKYQDKKKVSSAFQYLKKNGLVELKRENHDICIVITKRGKKRAGQYQINDLQIKSPKKWDKKWRIIIFDIPDLKVIERNAFRRKLKELGFYSLQKSVWVYPFDCQKEIGLLRDFFGIGPNQIQLLLVEKIEHDTQLKRAFKL